MITLHTANPSSALVALLAERIEENVGRFEAGEELIAVVDAEVGY